PTGHRCPACTCVRPRPHPAPGYTGCRVTWPRCPLCTAITGYAWGRPCPREGEGARATSTGCPFGLRSASCRIPLPTARVWGPPGRRGSTSRPRPCGLGHRQRSDVAPLRHPGAVLDVVVTEQRGSLLLQFVADEVEQQTDLFFCPGCGAGLDGVPQGAHIGGPHQAGGHTFGGETAHEGGLVLLLGELDALVVRSEEHTSELKSRFDLVCRLLLAT